MKINLIFIRHGFSCANQIKHQQGLWDQYKRFLMTDPPLSDQGVADCVVLKDHFHHLLSHVDFVMCSPMIRATETAMLLFPFRKVEMVPFIKEISSLPFGIQRENEMIAIKEQKQWFHESSRQSLYSASQYLSYQHVLNKQNKHQFSSEAQTTNLYLFFQWLMSWLKYNNLNEVHPKKEIINIAIVSHSHTISKLLDLFSTSKNKSKNKVKVDNLGMVLVKMVAIVHEQEWIGKIINKPHVLFQGLKPHKNKHKNQEGKNRCQIKLH